MQVPTPLDILLSTMRRKWSEGDCDGAAAIAKIIAPYVHPRKSPIATPAPPLIELHRLTDEELGNRLATAHRGAKNP